MAKTDFAPASAARIAGHFNPAIVRVDWEKLGPLPGFYDPAEAPGLIDKAAKAASHRLCRLERNELRDLDTFSVSVDMKCPIGADPVRLVTPEQADDLAPAEPAALAPETAQLFGFSPLASMLSPFRLLGVLAEDPADDELELLVATQIWARFNRVNAEKEGRVPTFTLTAVCPSGQNLPALILGPPPPEPEQAAVIMGTPVQIRLLRDTLFGEKKPTRQFAKNGLHLPLLTRPPGLTFSRQKHPRPPVILAEGPPPPRPK